MVYVADVFQAKLSEKPGDCRCKVRVTGSACDRCRPGFMGLSNSDPLGCQICQCNIKGTDPSDLVTECETGGCICKNNVEGLSCDGT